MARVIRRTTAYDEETGEIYYQQSYKTFNGWSEEGYKFRYRYNPVKFYPDNIPQLPPNVMKVFFLVCNIMNDDNLLMEYKKTRSKYKAPEIKCFTLDEIRERLPYKISEYSFKKAWEMISPKYVRKIKFNGKSVWAVNPAFANRTRYLPPWLWYEFREDLNPYLGSANISRFENMKLTEDMR